jgi:hypothetical protein
MDTESWIIATDSGSYRGISFGADGVTYVQANACRFDSPEQAAARIAELAAAGDTRNYHVEALPSGRKRYR